MLQSQMFFYPRLQTLQIYPRLNHGTILLVDASVRIDAVDGLYCRDSYSPHLSRRRVRSVAWPSLITFPLGQKRVGFDAVQSVLMDVPCTLFYPFDSPITEAWPWRANQRLTWSPARLPTLPSVYRSSLAILLPLAAAPNHTVLSPRNHHRLIELSNDSRWLTW